METNIATIARSRVKLCPRGRFCGTTPTKPLAKLGIRHVHSDMLLVFELVGTKLHEPKKNSPSQPRDYEL